jgi:hypothetical protein
MYLQVWSGKKFRREGVLIDRGLSEPRVVCATPRPKDVAGDTAA